MGNSASSFSSSSEKTFTTDTYILPPGCSKPILLDKHHFRRKVTSKANNHGTTTDIGCECCKETCDCFDLNLNVTKKKLKSKTKSTTKVIIHPAGIQPQPTQQLQLVKISPPRSEKMNINVPLYAPVPANGHVAQPVQLDNNVARAPQPGDYNYVAPTAAVQFAPPPPPAGAAGANPAALPLARFLAPPFQAGANYIVGGNLGGQLMMFDANPPQIAGYQGPMMVPLGTRMIDVEMPAAAAPQKDLENRVLMLQFSDGTQRYLTSNGQHLRASDYLNKGAFWAPEVGGFVRFTGETAG